MVAHRRALEPFPRARFQTVFLHQSDDTFATDALVLLDQILVNAGTTVPLATLIEGRPHQDAQPAIRLGMRGLRPPPRRVEATGRHLQDLTEGSDR